MHAQDEKDIVFEEALSRNKFSLKSWWSYIQAKARSPPKVLRTNDNTMVAWKVMSKTHKSNISAVWNISPCIHVRTQTTHYQTLVWLQFQDALYERALQCLPGSYKLWYSYLSTKLKRVRFLSPNIKLVRIFSSIWLSSNMYTYHVARATYDPAPNGRLQFTC